MEVNDGAIITLDESEQGFKFDLSIEEALNSADLQLADIQETIDSIDKIKPDCDKLDYALAASSGALCGIIDIFLVGKPGESPVGDITDQWFKDRTEDFARLCGWQGDKGNSSSAIRYLENEFKIPYDQRGAGDAASEVFDLNPKNHHFKSLGHNPSLLGLFFSVLDQFNNTSHFISDGEMIILEKADDGFELRGNNVPSKLFCGIGNWFGHLISDVSGSSGSKGRGMGIPSPLWSWTNDIIAIKSKLGIQPSEFNKTFNELAINIYKEGYDVRFQTAQLIPVVINELVVRVMYSVRRLVSYFKATDTESRSFEDMWEQCKPFGNSSVKRMLTVAHGTFCLMDMTDAVVRGLAAGGGKLNLKEFALRLNIMGIGRFTISLYGEARRGIDYYKATADARFAEREEVIIENYTDGLRELADIYDDKELLTFVDDLRNSDAYVQAFEKTVELAKKRDVPEEDILRDKTDIDSYFKP